MPMLTVRLYVAWQMLDVVVFVYLRMTPRPSARMNTARVPKDTLYWVWIEVNSNALTTKPSRGWIAPRNKISSPLAGTLGSAATAARLDRTPKQDLFADRRQNGDGCDPGRVIQPSEHMRGRGVDLVGHAWGPGVAQRVDSLGEREENSGGGQGQRDLPPHWPDHTQPDRGLGSVSADEEPDSGDGDDEKRQLPSEQVDHGQRRLRLIGGKNVGERDERDL